jgi:hypothetical protein
VPAAWESGSRLLVLGVHGARRLDVDDAPAVDLGGGEPILEPAPPIPVPATSELCGQDSTGHGVDGPPLLERLGGRADTLRPRARPVMRWRCELGSREWSGSLDGRVPLARLAVGEDRRRRRGNGCGCRDPEIRRQRLQVLTVDLVGQTSNHVTGHGEANVVIPNVGVQRQRQPVERPGRRRALR